MKAPLVLILISLLSATIASARIGETEAEITARYGEGKKAGDSRLVGTDRFSYVKNGFDVEVMFQAGKSVMEVLHRQDKEITDDDIKEILKANAYGHTWTRNRRTNEWNRGDRKVKAFRAPGHPDFLFVQDVAAVKDIDKKNKSEASAF